MALIPDRIITSIFRKVLPSSLLWKVDTSERKVFITFDDGPEPDLTTEILAILKSYDARATFFCVVENVIRHQETYKKIVESGHSVGNHTCHHLKGWHTPYEEYLEDISQAARFVESKLFRPPYGKITRRQAQALSKDYQVVMWSVLTRDYDPSVSREKCLETAIHGVEPGAIIVFHDNLKASEKVLYALPRLLEYLRKEGYDAAGL